MTATRLAGCDRAADTGAEPSAGAFWDSPDLWVRRADDGKLVCELERADVSALLATGWRPPERFFAPGRDGRTTGVRASRRSCPTAART